MCIYNKYNIYMYDISYIYILYIYINIKFVFRNLCTALFYSQLVILLSLLLVTCVDSDVYKSIKKHYIKNRRYKNMYRV